MSWKEDYVSLNYLSREVSQIVNERGDEIELEIIQFHDHYQACASICQDKPPFKDYFAEGTDRRSKRNAAIKAIKELYRQAYTYPSFQFILLNGKKRHK